MKVDVLGSIELLSVADGYRALDAILKAAPVGILKAEIINPGKFLILITGEVISVEYAMNAAISAGTDSIIDHAVLNNLSSQVLCSLEETAESEKSSLHQGYMFWLVPEIKKQSENDSVDSVGIIEANSITAAIEAADIAVKAAEVAIQSIEIGTDAGGKGITTIIGAIGDVQLAMDRAVGHVKMKEQLYKDMIISGLHSDVKGFLSGN